MVIFTVRIYKQYVNTVVASSRVSTLYDHSFLIWCECVVRVWPGRCGQWFPLLQGQLCRRFAFLRICHVCPDGSILCMYRHYFHFHPHVTFSPADEMVRAPTSAVI